MVIIISGHWGVMGSPPQGQLVAGYEGQPAIFDFAQVKRKKAYNRLSLFGSSGSDGECFYYNHPGGASVSNCD